MRILVLDAILWEAPPLLAIAAGQTKVAEKERTMATNYNTTNDRSKKEIPSIGGISAFLNWRTASGTHFCTHCKSTTKCRLEKMTCNNGAIAVYLVCDQCGKRPSRTGCNVPHALLMANGIDINSLPEKDDNSYVLCEVWGCDRPGAEIHHWAPKSVFADADNWPTSLLCRHHHSLWHKTSGLGLSVKLSIDNPPFDSPEVAG